MSKTLSTILTIFKVASIVTKVVFIVSIVGGAGCLFGLCFLPIVGNLEAIFDSELQTNVISSCASCAAGAVSCAGSAIFAFMAEKYFKRVTTDGTPFTFECTQ